MAISSTIRPPIFAEVMNFVSKAQARQLLSFREATTGEMIDPVYADNPRVLVQWKLSSHTYERTYVIVPTGMTVNVGEEISFSPSHADPDNLCEYIPSLILPQ